MNSLVELIKKNQTLNEFNMTNTNGQLLGSLYNNRFLENDDETPIVVEDRAEWNHEEGQGISYLQKTFKFAMLKHQLYFINEAIEVCNQYQHFPELMITENYVDVRLFTKDINEVTDIDIKLSKQIVDIYSEIKTLY